MGKGRNRRNKQTQRQNLTRTFLFLFFLLTRFYLQHLYENDQGNHYQVLRFQGEPGIQEQSKNDRFLLVKDPMRGGLNNQLMAFTAYGIIAAEANRTLVLPKFTGGFPKEKISTLIEFEDVFQLDSEQNNHVTLPSKRFPSTLVRHSDTSIPPNIRGFYLDKKKLSSFIASRSNDTVVAVSVPDQPMNERVLSKIYASFQPTAFLMNAIINVMAKYLSPMELEQNRWESVVVIHLRIETDWLDYSLRKKCPGQYYISLSQIQERLERFTPKIKDQPIKTIILSFASEALPPGTKNLRTGWPHGYDIITTNDILNELNKNMNKKPINYLMQSLALGHIAYRSNIFIGNWYSSFSRQLILSREESEQGKSFIYNNDEIEDMTEHVHMKGYKPALNKAFCDIEGVADAS